jgi:16S rRNA (guanine(966)-N(2))-methyltransferase RsmD
VTTPHRIRIIGGVHRGRQISVTIAAGLRPTPDRVRETLFNWLGQDLSGATTLEPYAGTGVLSLEALSRGAALAVAVDRNKALVDALTAAARHIGIEGLEAHAGDALRYLGRERRGFDVVFLDPPFADAPWEALFAAIDPLMRDDARIYAESGRPIVPPPSLRILRQARAGGVHYHLLARSAAAPSR